VHSLVLWAGSGGVTLGALVILSASKYKPREIALRRLGGSLFIAGLVLLGTAFPSI